jgi:hypothetical protein
MRFLKGYAVFMSAPQVFNGFSTNREVAPDTILVEG